MFYILLLRKDKNKRQNRNSIWLWPWTFHPGMIVLPANLSNMAAFNLSPAVEWHLVTMSPSWYYMISIHIAFILLHFTSFLTIKLPAFPPSSFSVVSSFILSFKIYKIPYVSWSLEWNGIFIGLAFHRSFNWSENRVTVQSLQTMASAFQVKRKIFTS